jgi:hypothetical protein
MYILGILAGILFLRGSFCCLSWFGCWDVPPEECEINTPSDAVRVIFARRPAHWIYAEYHRKIVFIAEDGEKVIKPLPINTGGKTFINVYWYDSNDGEGPYLRLLDRGGECLIDLQETSTKVIIRYKAQDGSGRVHTVAGVTKHKGNYSAEIGPDGVRYTVDGNPALRLKGQLAEQPGQYLGRLEDRGGGLTFLRTRAPDESMIDEAFLKFHPLPWLQDDKETIPPDPNKP